MFYFPWNYFTILDPLIDHRKRRPEAAQYADKSGCAYLAPRGIVGVRRLASEFGMGSGVSAGRSQPPLRRKGIVREPRKPNAIVLRTEERNESSVRNSARHGGDRLSRKGRDRSPRAIGASRLCGSRRLRRTSIERVTYPCPYPLARWEAKSWERLRA